MRLTGRVSSEAIYAKSTGRLLALAVGCLMCALAAPAQQRIMMTISPGAQGDSFQSPQYMVFDSQGNLFLSDMYNSRVQRIDKVTGVVTTIAGTGTAGYSGDGGPATAAQLNCPYGLALESDGALLIADACNYRIRKVAPGSDGLIKGNDPEEIISTYAGDGSRYAIGFPYDVAVDQWNNIFIASNVGDGTYIYRVDASTAGISQVFTNIYSAVSLAFDSTGDLLIGESNEFGGVPDVLIAKPSSPGTPLTGQEQTLLVLGPTGQSGYPLSAEIGQPYSLAFDSAGNLYVSDYGRQVVYKLTPGPDGLGAQGEGKVEQYAGTLDAPGYAGDGGDPLSANLNQPVGIALNDAGNLFIVDSGNNVIRGVINGVAADGTSSVVPLDQNGNTSPVTVTFDGGVTQSGYAAVVFRTSAPALPAGVQLAGAPPVFYDVATTTKFTAPLTVCINLNPAPSGTEILHYNQATQQWEDNTVAPVSPNGPVCAHVQSLSLFALVTTSSQVVGVTVNATNLDFGAQNVQTTSLPQIVTVTSTGVASAAFSASTLSGPNQGDFAIVSDGCAGLQLPNGGTCQISLTFTPAATGTRTANLQVNDNSPDSPQIVSLTGTGASLSINPVSLDFGSETQGFTTAPIAVTVTNGSASSVTILSDAISGANSGDFAVSSDNCSGVALSPQASCTFDVTFSPSAIGARSAQLSVSSTAADSPRTLNLSGSGIPVVVTAAVAPTSVPFGQVTIGNSSQTVSLSVTSTGTGTLTVSGVSLSGNQTRDFTVANDTCTGAALAPSQNCTVQVTFVPQEVCSSTAVLSFTDNASGSPQSVNLSGSGLAGALGVFQSTLYCTSYAAQPQDLVAGMDGRVWFDELGSRFASPAVGAVSAASGVQENPNALLNGWKPYSLTYAPDGSYAYIEGSGAGYPLYLDVVSAAGVKTQYNLSGNAGPLGVGPDGAFWYSAQYSCPPSAGGGTPLITRYAPGQAPVSYTLSFYWLAANTNNHYCVAPSTVTAGPDGTIWIGLGQFSGPVATPALGILRMSTDGAFLNYIPTVGYPTAATLGADGNLYALVGDYSNCTLEMFDAAGNNIILPLSTNSTSSGSISSCYSLTSGPDGLLWMVGRYFDGTNFVVSMLSFNPVTQDVSAHPAPATQYVTSGPDEDIWFNSIPSNVGRFDIGGGPSRAFVNPKIVNLPVTSVGASSGTRLIALRSTGTAPLTVSSVSLSGDNPSQFVINSDGCTGAVLAPDATCTVLVSSKPTQSGSHNATLIISDDSAFSPQIARLAQFALPPPPFVSPATLSFPSTAVGSTSTAQTLTLTNPGVGYLPVSSVSIGGTDAGDFALSSDNCSGSIVPPGGTCTVGVSFAPTASGTRNAIVSFTDDANPSTQTASLTGGGTSGGTGGGSTGGGTGGSGGSGGSGSCDCALAGNYVDPSQGVDVSGDPLVSPSNKFIVTSSIDNVNHFNTLTVTRQSDGQVLIPSTAYPITAHWGFSPDENRIAIHAISDGEDEIWVYDLTVTPARQVVNYRLPVAADRLQFSPSGKYFLLMALTAPGRTEINIYRVAGVSTQTLIFQTGFFFQSVPGVNEDSYGAVGWGFSPDKPETSFVYAYGNGQNTVSLNIANLASPRPAPVLNGRNLTGVAAFWQYNPCGNLLGVVWQPFTTQVEVDLFNTADGATVGHSGETFPLDTVVLSSTGTSEQATVGSNAPVDIAANPSCSGNTPTGTNVPVSPKDPTSGTMPVTITFADVTQAGQTTVVTGSSGAASPAGFEIGNPPTYYEVSTTASFAGTATICIDYSGVTFTGSPRLHHYVNGAWVDITSSVDTANHIVCGTTSSFSPFALFEQDQAPAITSANAVTFTAGSFSEFTVTATGAPAPAISETGVLPTGLAFTDNGDGTASLRGATASAGAFPITITASNTGGSVSQTFVLDVDQSPAITSTDNATWTVGTPASFVVTATGFPAPALSVSGSLPGGVTFDPSTGTLSGTPSASEVFSLTFSATNEAGTATQNFTLTVNQAPSFTSTGSAAFTVGTPGSFTVTATGFPLPALSETGALPGGVTFVDNQNGTGALSGTPTMSGAFNITFTAANGTGTTTQNFTLTVNQAPSITSTNSAAFVVGSPASFTVTATGFPIPALSETGALPGGITFVDNHNGTGTISGTPTAAGTFTVTFTAVNGLGAGATQPFTLTVSGSSNGSNLSVTPASIDFGTVQAFHLVTRKVTLQNMGTTPIRIEHISLNDGRYKWADDFYFWTTCSSLLSAYKSCAINVFYFGDDLGMHNATLTIQDSAPDSPQTVALTVTVMRSK